MTRENVYPILVAIIFVILLCIAPLREAIAQPRVPAMPLLLSAVTAPVSVPTGQPARYTVRATRPCAIEWYVDGRPVRRAAGPRFTFTPDSPGSHTVEALALTSSSGAACRWQLTVSDR